MPCPITLAKFTGVFSLGLLTGVSYTLSTQSLPSLLTLPSATPAAYTLSQLTRLATLHIRTLSSISASSLLLAYTLSPSRIRHPYLLWTGLVAATSGALTFALGDNGTVEGEGVNGEQVEKKARDAQWMEFVRTGISGVGFAMGVVGIWGDGAGRK
ncbi:unnamed protein product [Zymoseptoria tritici ST99CH_1A5]|uniref:Uncharacterized protein n=3 Tax=Zymoseptoria tritici TaxID=1047171 RepID=F9X5J4_ZYMTI|nr:uncharacterized protein MYCGRDRAFT_103620 [Zymoseptoria tritici IPO323]EGP88693.1 hypothetical protein MYCGRDRAFT_103620 [Zymoseptoria tritici IPO323]SMR48358.1 unnamed protein product [Zymoseptoria tritici ST99CH_1E4]SMR49568.1 unnamed protein product [Zymoseptoria tritici ST99CH_3D1]SMY22267.1 unnamed protein product [Zymoseptoria tritici ST99CH_1A5]